MVSIMGWCFTKIDKTQHNLDLHWEKQQHFFYKHKTLYDLIFLLIYFGEQLALFLLILLYAQSAQIFAGLFPLIFITTISFEKICMESRYKKLENEQGHTRKELDEMYTYFDSLFKENEQLRHQFQSKIKNNSSK